MSSTSDHHEVRTLFVPGSGARFNTKGLQQKSNEEVQVNSSAPIDEQQYDNVTRSVSPPKEATIITVAQYPDDMEVDADAVQPPASSTESETQGEAHHERVAVLDTPAKGNRFKQVEIDVMNDFASSPPLPVTGSRGSAHLDTAAPATDIQANQLPDSVDAGGGVNEASDVDQPDSHEASLMMSKIADSPAPRAKQKPQSSNDRGEDTMRSEFEDSFVMDYGGETDIKPVALEDVERAASSFQSARQNHTDEPPQVQSEDEAPIKDVDTPTRSQRGSAKSKKRALDSVEDESMDHDKSQQPPGKRRKENTVPTSANHPVNNTPIPSRGRGRPPKANAEAKEEATPTPSVVKRGRGRPPKASVSQSPAASFATPSSGRGRPRKVSGSTKEVDNARTLTQLSTSSASKKSQEQSSPRAGRSKPTVKSFQNSPPRVLFSNSSVKERPQLMKRLSILIGSVANSHSPDKFDLLVVGTSQLKRTSKLLIAVAAGKPVVTDEWARICINEGQLMPLEQYYPRTPKEWLFDPSDHADRAHLFKGLTIHVTPALKKSWGSEGYRDIETLAKTMGCANIISKSTRGLEGQKKTLFLGLEKEDGDCAALLDKGQTCYTRDLLPFAALRNHSGLSKDEFRVQSSSSPPKQQVKKEKPTAGSPETPTRGRGRPKKSR